MKGLLRLLRPHRARLLGGAACLLLLAATSAAYAYLTGPLLQVLLTGGRQGGGYLPLPRSWLGPIDGSAVLLGMAVALCGLALLKGLAHLGQALLLEGTAERIGHRLRVEVYEHLVRLPLGWYRRSGVGDLLTRLLDDVQRVQEAAVAAPIALAREGLAALALLGVALAMSPALTLAAALALPLVGLVIALLSRGVKRAARGRQRHMAALADRATVALSAIREVKSSGAEDREVAALAREGREALRWSWRRIALRAVAPLANEVMAAAALGLTLVYAGAQIAAGALAAERFVSFFAALLMLYRPVKALGQAVHVIASGAASVERVAALLGARREAPSGGTLPPLERRFELRGVCFSYEGSAGAAVRDVDLTLEAGSVVALAGPSGAGKSTLVSVACGLERPGAGALIWDGEAITDRPPGELRARVALVPQQPLVLPASLGENLRYGAPTAGDEQLRGALSAVGLDGLLARLGGLDAVLGPREGQGVSVGEAQRLAVARALLRGVKVLVLDEPSSALDAGSERRLVELLNRLRRDHAILVVAHSPALIAAADRVVWLRDGQVAPAGDLGGEPEGSAPGVSPRAAWGMMPAR